MTTALELIEQHPTQGFPLLTMYERGMTEHGIAAETGLTREQVHYRLIKERGRLIRWAVDTNRVAPGEVIAYTPERERLGRPSIHD